MSLYSINVSTGFGEVAAGSAIIAGREVGALSVPHKILITMGDIYGFGPEIVARMAADRAFWRAYSPVVLGSVDAYAEAAKHFKSPPARDVGSVEEGVHQRDCVAFLRFDIDVPNYRPGQLDAEAGRCAMEWVREGVRVVMEREADAIVTCPINKVGIHAAGYNVPGHTEFVAELCGAQEFRMSLFSESLRIVHVSGHLSLRAALDALTVQRIADSVRIGYGALRRLGLHRKRIAVAGLNPHAGEGGAFGDEEARIIAPAVALSRAAGIDCVGPLSPDTIFKRMRDGEFDLIVAMYHDQGHIPAKLVDMETGVNVTLGLPIVRTSVDHGTAYEIAGRGVARDGSLRAAVTLASKLCGAAHATAAR